MLSKNRRISKLLFEEILKKGKSFHFKNVSISVFKKQEINSESQFSVVVSKKVAKKAVDRNCLRRRIYNILRIASKEIKFPVVAVFFLKKGSEKLSFLELKEEINGLLQKSGCINNPVV